MEMIPPTLEFKYFDPGIGYLKYYYFECTLASSQTHEPTKWKNQATLIGAKTTSSNLVPEAARALARGGSEIVDYKVVTMDVY